MWTKRYKASAIDATNYLLSVSQYIESRPVHLGYVKMSQDYQWSSYQNNALGISDGLTSFHQAYIQLGDDPVLCQRSYRRRAGKLQQAALQQDIERNLALGLPLGSSRFKQELARILNVQPITLYPGRCLKQDKSPKHRNREYSEPA